MDEMVNISAEKMKQTLGSVLVKHGFTPEKAEACASIFTDNSVDGIYSHGINRFNSFVNHVRNGVVDPQAVPTLKHAFGGLEQWDGHRGIGVLNAVHATERAMALAELNGIGCAALSQTNHWMRAGYYGWKAARKGFVLIAWTNTIGNMPAWNATDSRLGNNPLMIALPFNEEAIVLDMAMSQYSYGALQLAAMKGEQLPVAGGYDEAGNLTQDPSAILRSNRPLPIGYWKGSGLSLLLDILSVIISGGRGTFEISKEKYETGLSQVFIAMDLSKLENYAVIPQMLQQVVDDYKNSVPFTEDKPVLYPGERVVQTRNANMKYGIPVLKKIWEEVLRLS
jgi:3-dehydro-L-gulonate 2-dehydrogenase